MTSAGRRRLALLSGQPEGKFAIANAYGETLGKTRRHLLAVGRYEFGKGDPQGHHDHPAGDPCALAPGRLPAILAVEIPLPRRPTATRRGPAGFDPANER